MPDLSGRRAIAMVSRDGPEEAVIGLDAPPGIAGLSTTRRDRRERPASAEPRRFRLRPTIGVKLGVLLAGLLAVLVASSGVLIAQTRTTAGTYQRLLSQEVRQSLVARQMQVEFKKQVQEWKDILLRGFDPADLARYTAAFQARDEGVKALGGQLLQLATDPDARARVAQFRAAHDVLDQRYQEALTVFRSGAGAHPEVADRMVRGIDRPPTDAIDSLVTRLEAIVTQRIEANRAATERAQRLTLIVAAGLLAVLASVLLLALSRIVRPIRELIGEANRTASERLPAAIATVRTMDLKAPAPELPAFHVSTRDELRDLADALTSLQNSALDQAVAQQRTDRETAGMLINLGRRNQNLLGRLLSFVTELERGEQDPDVLGRLFRLDHITTRIRRNAESMLVLAGATQTRAWSRPVPVIDVVRAALSEIEECERVDLHHLEEGKVNGYAVSDLVHLIAELVENATHFSPPTARVTVVGQRAGPGYRLRVIDEGLGMTQRELDEANERIRRSEAGWTDSPLLGLHVVGRLARRRGIEVALESSAGRGITATLLLPTAILGDSARSEDAPPPLAAPLAAPAGNDPETGPITEPETGPIFGPITGPVTPRVLEPATPPAAAGPGGEGIRTAPPAVPRRVRGAQLPDLGPAAEPVIAGPAATADPADAESMRWQLRSFQLDVQAARRAIREFESHDDAAGSRHGRHPEGE